MTINDILDAVCGEYFPGTDFDTPLDTEICGVSTDSRSIERGELFVALPGEFFDGHNYVHAAFERGAACCLVSREVTATGPVIAVADTYLALLRFAEYHRNKFDILTVAITGSVGKTTTKDIVGAVVSTKFNTLVTKGNLNNEIGLPLMIMKLNAEHEAAVLEMGMNHFGEISRLSKIVQPDICLITNIGVAHMENLGSREGILRAKAEIFDYMADGGCAVLNGDDKLLRTLKLNNTLYYGLDPGNDVYADNISPMGLDGVSADIHYKEQILTVKIPMPGRHMVSNALAAAAVGFKLGLTAEQIAGGIEKFRPSKMRMNLFKAERTGILVIDDTYNSNPDSMIAALDVLGENSGRKAVIAADMLELGSTAEQMHREIGEYIASKKIDILIAYGELSRCMADSAMACCEVFHFTDREEMQHNLPSILTNVEFMLVKGSRGMKLEQTVEWIRNNL